ncbi:transposase [Parashewanella curva]|uniref:transposase n=1 Tax=Parashewanella curva TaxID=2338552 RepID=UPI001FB51BC0|nr:transposase [Parashewanella curva]
MNYAWLWAEQYNLEIRYLPSYSPELNAIEILWRKIKYEWLSISAYETYSKLKKAVETILDNYCSKYEITFS